MTVLVKHNKSETGQDGLVIRNGKNTVLFAISDNMGEHGIAFDVFKGKTSLVGFNLLGQRMSGPYNCPDKSKFALSGFEAEGRAARSCYVEGTEGQLNHVIFTVDKEPLDRITFCDGEGNRAIDVNIDKDGRISSVCRAAHATTKENLVVMFENEKDPKLNRTVDLNKTSYYHFNKDKRGGIAGKIAGLAASTKPDHSITR